MSTILVTDDDAMSLKMAEMVLKKGGYEVLKAQSGEECISVARDNSADIGLILLDREMPGMDGIKTLEMLKADESVKNIPVLMLTGTVDEMVQEKAAQGGADGCLGKPFKPPVLLEAVAKYF